MWHCSNSLTNRALAFSSSARGRMAGESACFASDLHNLLATSAEPIAFGHFLQKKFARDIRLKNTAQTNNSRYGSSLFSVRTIRRPIMLCYILLYRSMSGIKESVVKVDRWSIMHLDFTGIQQWAQFLLNSYLLTYYQFTSDAASLPLTLSPKGMSWNYIITTLPNVSPTSEND